MYSAILVGFFALAVNALQASALQVVKRQSTRTGILLPRQSSVSCVTICTSADNAITACGDPTCLCTTSIANNLQQCVNCLLEGSPDATTLTDVDGIVTDFDSLCSGFPVPAVTTAGSISTPAGTQTTKSTTTPSQSPTPKSNTNSASTPITSPGGAGTTLPANGGSATAPASSVSNTPILPSTIVQITVGPSDVSGPSGPAASTTGPITFGGLSSGSSGGRIVDFVLLTFFGGGALLLVL